MVVNALSGTELDGADVVVVLAEEAVLVVVPTPEVSALLGALSTPEDGVYLIEDVVALEPADDEPDDAYEDDAPGPDPPDEALLWMYSFCRLDGLACTDGSASRITWYWLSCVYMVLIWRCPNAS